ncbi:outer membrane lipoprotein-sorting protein [Myxococcus stipitatus]|uniref:outer membrane lipoprotein-sorting protein n=1 Tax=Myxococcus stipitatus TaxID=83455 RepID=UPI0030D5C3DF
MSTSARCLAALLTLLSASAATAEEKAPKPPEAKPAAMSAEDVLRQVDARMALKSDFKSTVRLREKRKDGTEALLEMLVFRRDASRDLLIYITKPRNMAGGGYLRIGRNLWEYDPSVGHWQRTTSRGNIVNTISCEEDFDRSHLLETYEVQDEGEEAAAGTKFRKLLLKVRPGMEASFPQLRIWVDPDYNIVKRVGYAPSGRVLRTDIIRGYQKIKDPAADNRPVFLLREVLEVEEAEGTQLTVRYDEVELAPLSPNIFTKTWLESRFR